MEGNQGNLPQASGDGRFAMDRANWDLGSPWKPTFLYYHPPQRKTEGQMVESSEAGQFSGRRDELKPGPAAPQIIHLCLGGFAGDGCLELLILRSLERALRGEMGARAVCEARYPLVWWF